MTQVTFFTSTNYMGGRSHRNRTVLEFCENDIFTEAENRGMHVYPIEGEDFENGVNDWNGNEVMNAYDYQKYIDTGIGCLDFREERIYTCELKDISNDEFCELPKSLMLDFINLDNDITMEMLEFALSKDDARWIYEFTASQWDYILNEMNESNLEGEE